MQITQNTNIFNVQSIFQSSSINTSQAQATSGGDTLQISAEARALYEKSLIEKQEQSAQTSHQADQSGIAELLMVSPVEEETTEETIENTLAQDFSEILDKHRGSSSSSDSSTDAIEKIEKQIQQVSSELASASAAAVSSGSTASSARVEQLQAELTQLESQLTQAQETATQDDA